MKKLLLAGIVALGACAPRLEPKVQEQNPQPTAAASQHHAQIKQHVVNYRTSFNDIKKIVGEDVIVDSYKGSSQYSVVVFLDHHGSKSCQANTYLDLFALHPHTLFVGAEGAIDEQKLSLNYCNMVKGKDTAARDATVRGWLKRKQYPDMLYSDGILPFRATDMNECVRRDEVLTIGLEDEKAHTKAADFFKKQDALLDEAKKIEYSKKAKDRIRLREIVVELSEMNEQLEVIVINGRDTAFVANIETHAQKYQTIGKDVIPFPVGSLHQKSLTSKLKDKDISYLVVQNDGCKRK